MIKIWKKTERLWDSNTRVETGGSPCAPIAEDGIINPLNADMKNGMNIKFLNRNDREYTDRSQRRICKEMKISNKNKIKRI